MQRRKFIMALGGDERAAELAAKPRLYIAPVGAGMNAHALRLAAELRKHGVVCELGDESFRLKKSFETAERLGIQRVVIIGENEVASGAYSVKDLTRGEQVTMKADELAGMGDLPGGD